MIRAVVWKELREQWLIAATLLVVGGGLLVAVAALTDPPVAGAPPTDVLRAVGAAPLVALMLVVTAAMVCGGALFAAEREAGTMGFLDALPARRWTLWRAKVLAGALLAAAQVALVLVLAALVGVADAAFAQRLVAYAVLAFCWGALGSTLARTTLGSVGVAIPCATLTAFVVLIPVVLFFARAGSSVPRPTGWAIFEFLMVAVPLGASAWRFTAPDRARTAAAVPAPVVIGAGGTPPVREGRPWLGGRALAWLAYRQMRVPAAVLSAFAVAFGLVLLLPGARVVFVWPGLALTAGVVAGLLAFGDEQANRSAGFWAEHRLPLGRAWVIKITLYLGLLAWLLFLLALPCLLRAQFESEGRFGHGRTTFAAVFRSRLFDELGPQAWKYTLVPAVYGFAFGHLCGLLFRKLVVACGVAAMLGGASATLWGPSLLAGGLSHWQVWPPAALILLTGRALARAWAADRLAARGPVRALIRGCGAASLALAVAVGYRAVEVPDPAGAGDDEAFVAALPQYDENLSGREFRIAADRFARVASALDGAEPRRRSRLDERLETALRAPWPKAEPELGPWLTRLCDDAPTGPDEKGWPALAAGAAAKPVGVYDPPPLVQSAAVTQTALDNGRRMAVALLARGLQLQGEGSPAGFTDSVGTALALARTMRRGAWQLALAAAIEVERAALYAADRWLERAGSGAAPCRTLLRALTAADEPDPFDPLPFALADRYVVRGFMQAPAAWLAPTLTPLGGSPEQVADEADLVGLAWAVWWERERTRRLLGLNPNGAPRANVLALVAGRPGAGMFVSRNRAANDLTDAETLLRVVRRAMILKLAVRAHEAERGTVPADLGALVAHGYLDRAPPDPYADGRALRYRVSAGETLTGPPRPAVAGRPPEPPFVTVVRPNQAVVWSAGVDRADDGGTVPPGGPMAKDIVFLVPPLPR
ncbi:MAG: hypothetical protein FJ304_01855 [Planctomycetes bacterium]|nr:hypothetical protein [Planctomycetota bacterium]